MFDRARFLRALKSCGARIDREIVVLRCVDSTSSELLRRLKSGAAPRAVVIAEEQTGGRGRQDRAWFSPPRGNLYMSLAVDVAAISPERISRVPLAAGVALAETVRTETGVRAVLKWPNDLLVGGKKVAGILCELPGANFPVLVVGVGLNVGSRRFPGALARTAASLPAAADGEWSREHIAARWVCLLEQRMEADVAPGDCGRLIADWVELGEGFGRRVKVDDVVGKTVGLDGEGRLLVEADDGELVSVPGGIVEDV